MRPSPPLVKYGSTETIVSTSLSSGYLYRLSFGLPMLRRFRIAIIGTLVAVLPMARSAAQSSQPLSKDVVAARIDSMARARMVMGPVGMSVAVSRGHEVLFERAYGMADIAAGRPATAASIYRIGAVSGQFTAALVLRQVDKGKLALTDSIGRYLTTGLRPEWRSLTIEQLLSHTAGLPLDLKREGAPQEEASTATMIAWAARDTMRFAPGTRFGYSSVGYLLLGALVEKLYGKPYDAALREEIASPLGLKTLGWCAEGGKDTLLTTPYEDVFVDDRRPTGYMHPSRSLGAGGLCASAADLAAWNRALHGGRVLSPASYTAMTTPRAAPGGPPVNGWGIQVHNSPPWGIRTMWLLSGGAGFAAENAWFPADSLSVTVLYNSFGGPAGPPFALEIAQLLSPAASVQQPTQPTSGGATAGTPR